MGDTKERYNEQEVTEIDNLIRGSYNDFVRLERRNLLLISSIILIASLSGLSPDKASLLGFSFENLSPRIFYGILLALNIYFLSAFYIYSAPTHKDARKVRAKIISESWIIERVKPWYLFIPANMSSNTRYYGWVFLHYLLPLLWGGISCLVALAKIF